jgi:leucyl aminopeptidase (aminopeptidase T)
MESHVKLDRKEDLERMVARWRERKETTRKSAEGLANKTESYFVQIVSNAVRRDAEKHEEILKAILDCLDCTVAVTPDELGELSDLLEAHLQIEKQTRELAELALKKHRHYITTYLLKYILEDEKKNFGLRDQLNEFKGRLYPYG